MDEGRIKDQGPHIVLVDRNEQYSSLIKTFLHENKEIHGPKSEIQKEVDNKTVTIFRPRFVFHLYMRNHIKTNLDFYIVTLLYAILVKAPVPLQITLIRRSIC